MRRSSGMALLETAGILAGLLGVVLGAAALADYLTQTSSIDRSLGRWVRADAVKPFTVRTDASGQPALVLNQTGLDGFLDAAVNGLSSEIAQTGFRVEVPFVEVGYAVLSFDPTTGHRLTQSPIVVQRQHGLIPAEQYLHSCPDLRTQIERFLAQSHGGADAGDLGAVPDSQFGQRVGGVVTGGYLDRSVAVAARAGRDLRAGFVGRAFGSLSGTQVAYSCVVTLLRGEISNL